MSFGLRVYTETGRLVLDTGTVTVRLIDCFDVGQGESGARTDPRYAGCVVVAVGIQIYEPHVEQRSHFVWLSGTTVNYQPGAGNYRLPSRIYLFKNT